MKLPQHLQLEFSQAINDTFEALRVHLKNPEVSEDVIKILLCMDLKMAYKATKNHLKYQQPEPKKSIDDDELICR